MARFLIILAIVLVAASLSIAGRHRFHIKEGSRTDHLFEQLQFVGNVAAIGLELLLPIVTGFLGLPLLAYAAAAFQLLAVTSVRVELPPIRTLRPGTSGKHSVDKDHLRRTRWPYQTAFALGYVLLLVYVATIFGMYF